MSINEQKVHIGNVNEIRPTFNRVLLRVKKVEEKTKGGIILPDDIREKDFVQGGLGVVVKMGSLAFLDHDDAPEIGEVVRTNFYVGLTYEDDAGNHYCLVQDKDVVFTTGLSFEEAA